MGFNVNGEGLIIDVDKVSPILEYPCPENLKLFRQFVGATSWYRKFIGDYAKICKPLTRLTKKNVGFFWAEDQEMAFQSLKTFLTTSSVVAYPDFNIPFCIQSDANGLPCRGLGHYEFPILPRGLLFHGDH